MISRKIARVPLLFWWYHDFFIYDTDWRGLIDDLTQSIWLDYGRKQLKASIATLNFSFSYVNSKTTTLPYLFWGIGCLRRDTQLSWFLICFGIEVANDLEFFTAEFDLFTKIMANFIYTFNLAHFLSVDFQLSYEGTWLFVRSVNNAFFDVHIGIII